MSKAFIRSEPVILPGDSPLLGYTLQVDPDHPYLQTRGLQPETVAEFGIGHCVSDPLKQRIAIPVHNAQGEVLGYAGRIPNGWSKRRSKYKFIGRGWPGSDLFNLHRVLREPRVDPVILVTGFFDVMHLWQLGHRNAVAIMGWELSSWQMLRLLHYFPSRRFIALYDETEYGHAARSSALRELTRYAYVHVAEFCQVYRLVESLTAEELEELL